MLGASKNAYQSLIKLVDSNKNLHSFEMAKVFFCWPMP